MRRSKQTNTVLNDVVHYSVLKTLDNREYFPYGILFSVITSGENNHKYNFQQKITYSPGVKKSFDIFYQHIINIKF